MGMLGVSAWADRNHNSPHNHKPHTPTRAPPSFPLSLSLIYRISNHSQRPPSARCTHILLSAIVFSSLSRAVFSLDSISYSPMDPHHVYNPYLNVKLNPPDRSDRERVPQWNHAETAELLAIRAELDASFMETKRNKSLWEAVSARMHHKGFPRTPDQCKSKWKNLLTRFKGSETSRQFPFHDEMQKIFLGRTERLLSFDHGKEKGVQDQTEESDEEEKEESNKKKRRAEKKLCEVGEVKRVLKELTRWQMETHARWLNQWEARVAERRLRDEEWKRAMKALEEERLAMEERWKAREEEWRARTEARAERQHALITAILTKLTERSI